MADQNSSKLVSLTIEQRDAYTILLLLSQYFHGPGPLAESKAWDNLIYTYPELAKVS